MGHPSSEAIRGPEDRSRSFGSAEKRFAQDDTTTVGGAGNARAVVVFPMERKWEQRCEGFGVG